MNRFHICRILLLRLVVLFWVFLWLPEYAAFAQDSFYNGWTLTHDDEAYNLSVLDRMPEFGVTHVQLSHAIISRIDECREETVAARVKILADRIHEKQGKVIVWAQELPYNTSRFCFDLDGEDMQSRMSAYRYALNRLSEIDGVMISFGSAPTELDNLAPSGKNAADYAEPKERYMAMIEAVSRVVEDEFGKQVYVRTFYHKSEEMEMLGQAMREMTRPIVVMSKAVPNDFEPYYPLNPLIGEVGDHPQILELDSAGEYWGKGAIPFVASEYFKLRFWQTLQKTTVQGGNFIGSTCRVDRYDRPAMGTLNEANIYAQTYLVHYPEGSWTQALTRFIEDRYGLTSGTEAFSTLFNILRRTFWIGKKMYYVKGEWAFTKGSELPSSDSAAFGLQLDKSIMQWNPDYASVFLNLLLPDPQVVLEILQEKNEAVELAERNLQALPSMESALDRDEYTALYTWILKQKKATEIWFHMAGTVFGRRCVGYQASDEAASWVKWHLRSLKQLAAQLKSGTYGLITDPYPFDPEDITVLIKNSRSSLSAPGPAGPPDWRKIHSIRLFNAGTDRVEIGWLAEAGVSYRIEVTRNLPDYPRSISYEGPERETAFTIDGLDPGSPYWFRIYAEKDGKSMVSGDFSFWTAQ